MLRHYGGGADHCVAGAVTRSHPRLREQTATEDQERQREDREALGSGHREWGRAHVSTTREKSPIRPHHGDAIQPGDGDYDLPDREVGLDRPVDQ